MSFFPAHLDQTCLSLESFLLLKIFIMKGSRCIAALFRNCPGYFYGRIFSVSKASKKRTVSINKASSNQSIDHQELKPLPKAISKDCWQIKYAPILIILLVTCGVFFNAFSGGFVFDDKLQIVDNPWIRDFGNIATIFSKSVWSFQSEKLSRIITDY